MKTFTKNYYPFARLLLLVAICAIGAVAAKAANPTIIIIGDNPYRHQVNTPYADPGATATDDMGNDITGLITTNIMVNENSFGAYQVEYTVTDGNGNTAKANRTVIVTDVIRPTLNINPQVIVVDLNDFNFVEPTVTATDNYYPAVNLTRTGSFDVTIEGTYPIFYEANDASGNSDTGTRLIIVRKRGATGISDIDAESFRVYPNPTAGKFEIEFAVLPGEKANLTVINTLGQTIRAINTTEIINGKIAVDMSSAAPGIYFIQIQTGEKVATQKLTLSR